MQREYGEAILKHIGYYAALYNIAAFDTIFVGGGTPLTMGAEWFLQLRDMLEKKRLIPAVQEWTVELNPENITARNLAILTDAGVNRLSVGVQSFDSAILSQMGRRYNSDFLQERLIQARESIDNLSVDIIYGMELQRSIEEELEKLFSAVSVEHISCYSYSLPSKKTHLKQSSDEQIEREEQAISHQLTKRGFAQYEVSNWALPNRESLHNLGYWRSETYLGIGTSAHSFIPDKSQRLHWNNDIRSFIDGGKPVVETVTRQEEIKDFLLMGLRVNEGISLQRFHARFGVDFTALFGKTVLKLHAENLIEISALTVKMTERGVALLNDVLLLLFRDVDSYFS